MKHLKHAVQLDLTTVAGTLYMSLRHQSVPYTQANYLSTQSLRRERQAGDLTDTLYCLSASWLPGFLQD